MEGLLVLAALIILIVPLLTLLSLGGLKSQVSSLQKSIDTLVKSGVPQGLDASTHEDAPKPASTQPSPDNPEPAFTFDAVTQYAEVPPASDAPETEIRPDAPLAEQITEGAPASTTLRSCADVAPPPSSPPEPGWIETKRKEAVSWLLAEGNIWIAGGVLFFLVGFGLLFQFVTFRGLFPLEMRLALAAVVGIVQLAFGWRMREKRRTYALLLQGSGIGILYLVVLAACRLAPIIPVSAAIIGMLLLSVFTVVLALYQKFQPLALFALLCGYAAPLLISTGGNNFVALFSVHTLLNFEILLLSLFQDWRKTRWLGLAASFSTGVVWGVLRWDDAYFLSVEPFLILFFLVFSTIALIPLLPGKFRLPNRLPTCVDMPFFMATPFFFLFLQIAATAHTRYGVAISCLILGAYYLALGNFFLKRLCGENADKRPAVFLGHSALIYCILFSSLAMPFIFQHASATAIWAVEGAFLVAFAARQKQKGALFLGLLMHLAAFLLYNLAPYLHLPAHLTPFLASGLLDDSGNSPYLLTGLLFAAAAFVSSYFATLLDKHSATGNVICRIRGLTLRLPPPLFLVWFFALYGTVWWVLAVRHAVFATFKGSGVTVFALLCLGGAAGYALSAIPRRKGEENWYAARSLAVPPLVLASLAGIAATLSFVHSGSHLQITLGQTWYTDLWQSHTMNWCALAALFTCGVFASRSDCTQKVRWYGHIAWGTLLCAFISYSTWAWGRWATDLFPKIWTSAGGIAYFAAFLPLGVAIILLTLRRFRTRLALDALRESSLCSLCLLMLSHLPYFIKYCAESADWMPLYIPVFNTLEYTQLLYLAAAAQLSLSVSAHYNSTAQIKPVLYALSLITFLWLNSIAARAAWIYFGESPAITSLLHAPYFQAIIALLWGIVAFSLIYVGGKKYANRMLWRAGAILIALDTLKLIAIDTQNIQTMLRILVILFLGGVFLLIGWIAPLPPKQKPAAESDTGDASS